MYKNELQELDIRKKNILKFINLEFIPNNILKQALNIIEEQDKILNAIIEDNNKLIKLVNIFT